MHVTVDCRGLDAKGVEGWEEILSESIITRPDIEWTLINIASGMLKPAQAERASNITLGRFPAKEWSMWRRMASKDAGALWTFGAEIPIMYSGPLLVTLASEAGKAGSGGASQGVRRWRAFNDHAPIRVACVSGLNAETIGAATNVDPSKIVLWPSIPCGPAWHAEVRFRTTIIGCLLDELAGKEWKVADGVAAPIASTEGLSNLAAALGFNTNAPEVPQAFGGLKAAEARDRDAAHTR